MGSPRDPRPGTGTLKFPSRAARDLHRWLLDQGWQLTNSRANHYRYRHSGTGNSLSVPGTPSEYRSILNLKAQATRLASPLGSSNVRNP